MSRSIVPTAILTLAVGLTGSCDRAPPGEGRGAPPDRLDHGVIATVLLERLDLQPDERVLLVTVPGRFDALVDPLRSGIQAAGAMDLGVWAEEGEAPADWSTDFTERLAVAEGESRRALLREVDAAVMMPGATPEHPVYGGLQRVLGEGRGRTVHFHWAGAYGLDGTLLDMDPARDAFNQRVLVETG